MLAGVLRREQIPPLMTPPRHRIALLLALAVACWAPAAAAQEAADDHGGLVGLSLPIGARTVGQGRAAVASLGDLQALPYNPAAAAAGLERGGLTFSRFEGAEAAGFSSSYVAGAWAGGWGTLAAQAILHDFGEIPITVDSPTPVGTLDVSEWVLGVTYANVWRERVHYGVTAKLFTSDLGAVDGSSPAFDVGVIYRPRTQLPLDLAVALRNLGPDLEYDGTETDGDAAGARLPSRVRVGLRYRPDALFGLPPEYALAFSFDSESDVQELSTTSVHAGVAATVHDVVVIRGGILFADNPYIEEGSDNRETGGAFGIGIRYGDFEADVAREVSVSELGDETHFSVGFRF